MTQSLVRSARREERSAQIRADLLAAAERLLAEKGVDRATISDITTGAGVGFGTFYNYFSSKGDIYRSLVRSALDMLVERIDERCSATHDHRARLRIAAEEAAGFAAERTDLFLLLFATDVDVQDTVREGVDGLCRTLERWLSEGFAEGAFQPVEPSLAARAMIGIFAFVLRPLARQKAPREEIRSSLVRLIEGAVMGPPSQSGAMPAAGRGRRVG